MKIHKPKKLTNTNILRAMLLNINENLIFNAEDYNLSQEKFDAYIYALIKQGIVCSTKELPIKNSSSLIITNLSLFFEWGKSNFYRHIQNFVIPLLSPLLAALPALC